jgi:hypothetical protein
MSEHRKEQRKKLIAFTPVYDSKNKTLLGYVYDLTMKGVMVVGERSVEPNQDKVLKIDLPGNLETVIFSSLIIPARVAWCRPDEAPGNFNIGFEFKDLSPENSEVVQAILNRYQFRPDSTAIL